MGRTQDVRDEVGNEEEADEGPCLAACLTCPIMTVSPFAFALYKCQWETSLVDPVPVSTVMKRQKCYVITSVQYKGRSEGGIGATSSRQA